MRFHYGPLKTKTPIKKKTPAKKVGGRRTTIETPDLNAEVEVEVRKQNTIVRSNIRAGEIKPLLEETVWRVLNEISPDLENTNGAQLNSDEFAYIMMLTMLVGYDGQHPRRGMVIRNHDYGRETPLCRTHR